MTLFRILVDDRIYTKWSFYYCDTNVEVNSTDIPSLATIDPIKEKLFSRDVFTISDSEPNNIEIKNSYLRTTITIAGVLQLENNKTFGRTENKKRLLYKCIPDDKHIPVFLIPYDVKSGFSKVQKNKYVVFKYEHWNDKHPRGILVETLGDVSSLEVFYEYQLYCKSLYHSITEFTKKTREELNKQSCEGFLETIKNNPNFNIEDRRSEYIFTIDPLHSLDYDDGFSIKKLSSGNWIVSIYIANVYFWLETLGLWNSFSKRVATIYLPDRRRPMLPTILSDSLCSLQENHDRFALAMDVIVDNEGNIIDEDKIQYKNVIIRVKKNYVYNEPSLLMKDKSYIQLYELSVKINNRISDSNDVVSHWMVFMNSHSGKQLLYKKSGIFRCANYININKLDNSEILLDDDTYRIIQNWNNSCGHYVKFDEHISELSHDLMNIKSYVHFTSPIRRLIDLLNQMLLMDKYGIIKNMSNDARKFLDNWLNQMEYLNTTMRAIRKIQTDCTILQRCFDDPLIMERSYSGIIFDKVIRNDGYLSYMVYLKELKLLSRITTSVHLENYSHHAFNIYLFEDEDNTKKKIRLQFNETK
jgi:exoribonuclease R